ncbi:MAG: hypothetical protein P8J37_16645 [Fuerstiella sp.]|nr:hypothetical protein [Fuerstiella sp.]
MVPLFPEVRNYLWELHEETEDGGIYVLPNIRHTTNVLPTLQRIIKRAGLKVWPKAWQNMRASRATELENEFGTHKTTQWCGHTEKIAEAHYWMVTADAVKQASEWESGAHLVQQVADRGGNSSQARKETPAFTGVCEALRGSAEVFSGARGT